MHTTHGLLALASFAPALFAQGFHQDGPDGPTPFGPNFAVELAQWRADHGPSWHVAVDRTTAHLEMLYGGNTAGPFTPTVGADAEWISLARHFVDTTQSMHGIANGDLTSPRVVFLPLGLGNGTDKITVGFAQEIGGVPVENGSMNLLFNTSGRLLSVQSTGAPLLSGAATTPSLSADAATTTAVGVFRSQEKLEPTSVVPAELIFAQVEREGLRRAHLAWRVEAEYHVNGEDPVGYEYKLDAHTGQVLERHTTIHYFDVTGTVQTNASPGTLPDYGPNPPAMLPAGHIRLTSSAGTVFADRDGNFTFPGINTPLDITATYVGNFNQVFNDAGAQYSVTFPNVQPNQSNTLLMNPSPTQQITAQANGYRHIGTVRDYVRDITPGDATADFVAVSNVNQSSTCNAFFDGSSVNYFLAGGGCNNTAYSTVVAHEFGHWLNVLYGTDNGPDGMGEGNADVFAMYIFDNPIVAEEFFTNGNFIRTGENTRQFCGDANPGCHGGVHDSGEVWMGAAWKVRRNLNTTLGDSLGDATANQLFMGWMNGFNQTQIRSIIEIQWLMLDDDDGDINNGTPNYNDIDAGFLEQGFPGFELAFILFSNVTELPDTTNEAGPYTVEADLVPQFTPPITAADVFYSVDGGAFQSLPMANTGGNTYRADLPGIPSPSIVQYYVQAADGNGNANTFPNDAPSDTLDFAIGNLTTFLFTEFEGASDEGWVVGSPTDTATTGVWVRDDPIGTPAQTEDDHTDAPGTRCWFTGQGSPGGATGENDVDGGETTLTSPVFDASSLTNPTITYWLWYSATNDPFRVQVSNNGGSSWSNAITLTNGTGGWNQRSIDLASVVPLSSTMQVRFVAADLQGGSIVEAAVDDIEGIDLSSSCDAPNTYCAPSPNSAGPGAQLLFFGSQSVATNDVNLFIGGAPAFEFGLFFYGMGQTSFPLGEGVLCVDLPFTRFSVVQTDLLGQVLFSPDLSSPPDPAAQILPGSTWNFQFWYRDAAGGPSGSNLSSAIEVQFCQ
ncbi:MAG: hypothetical protein GY711_19060 [bacterium]|nr:hypothetical protein [bacterium]